MVWLQKAEKQKVYFFLITSSTMLFISASNLGLFMALKVVMIYFYKPSVMVSILWVCACVWTKGVDEGDLRHEEVLKSKQSFLCCLNYVVVSTDRTAGWGKLFASAWKRK